MEQNLPDVLQRNRMYIAALKTENQSLRHQRQVLDRLLQTGDLERRMIAYEIHDGLAQHLAAALMHLRSFDHLKDSCPEGASQEYEAARTRLEECHAEARQLINGLRPVMLDELGIVAAIENLVQEANNGKELNVEFYPQVDFMRLSPPLENALYRIVQESLNNARQHSQSEHVRIDLRQKEKLLRLGVQDWGIGLDLEKVKKSRFGLEGIRKRARMLGGKAVIESVIGCGTRIVVRLPLGGQSRYVFKERKKPGKMMVNH